LEFIWLETAERLTQPDRFGALPDVGKDFLAPPLDQFGQCFFEAPRKLIECVILFIGRQELAAIGEMALPEFIESVELRDAAITRLGIAWIDRRGRDVAKRQQIGCAARARSPEGLLVLPFGPGY